MRGIYRYLLIGLGILSIVIGVIGIFLPVLPTVPFLILSGFCFSRSSPRLHRWLLSRPKYGPLIKEWEEHGVISRKIKVIATLTTSPLLIYSFVLKTSPLALRIFLPTCFVAVMIFIWTRPNNKISSQ